ncbi:hypothetical protein DPEC_G00125320 [Dallia pectoralis]|uniref:Uncharacterized protein n=1 Tax=Dallia pectoralis TaxID=75939 RepID=A0ACC2GRY3_DALPE|nr:hypothetical protein DPEC_G00125320 [Dallia pectoralis]
MAVQQLHDGTTSVSIANPATGNIHQDGRRGAFISSARKSDFEVLRGEVKERLWPPPWCLQSYHNEQGRAPFLQEVKSTVGCGESDSRESIPLSRVDPAQTPAAPTLPYHRQRVVLVVLGPLEINYGCNAGAVKFVVSSIISMLKATKALQ